MVAIVRDIEYEEHRQCCVQRSSQLSKGGALRARSVIKGFFSREDKPDFGLMRMDGLSSEIIATAGGYSQLGQDLIVKMLLPAGKVFVEIGAYDGLSGSNTKLLEDRGWTGLAIEPNVKAFEQLQRNRRCICLPFAIGCQDSDATVFKEVSGYSAMLSGISDQQSERHANRIEQEIAQYGGNWTEYTVPERTLKTVFCDYNITECDYMSIDVEGAEEQVAKSLTYQEVRPKLLSVENNYDTPEVAKTLGDIGYRKLFKIAWEDFYAHESFDLLSHFRS
jgi:FkbM family methyltransferase